MIVATTERLALRRLTPADAKPLEAIFCDPGVMRFGGVKTPAWVRDLVAQTLNDHYPTWGFGRYAVIDRASHSLIGQCGLVRGRCAPDEAEIVYRYISPSWGRGYATEAAAAVTGYAFAEFGLPRIVAFIDPDNAGSIRVVEKLGARRDGSGSPPEMPDLVEHRYVIDAP